MKKLFGIIAIAAIVAAAGWNFSQNKNDIILSELSLANIEALANPEGGGHGCWIECCQTNYNGCVKILESMPECTSWHISLDTGC